MRRHTPGNAILNHTHKENNSKGKWVFEGKTIRLNQQDFNDWKKAYSSIPDLRAELKSLDDYYTSEKVDKWFPRTSAALAKKNAHYLAGKKTPAHKMTDAEYNALHSDLVTSNPMGGAQ